MNIEFQDLKSIRRASHDLKNPINILVSCMSLLEKDVSKIPKLYQSDLCRTLSIARKGIHHLRNLLDTLLKAESISDELGELCFESLNLSQVISDVATLNTQIAKERGIMIEFVCPDDLFVRANRNALTSIFDNLISNAVKHSPEAGLITINTKIFDDRIGSVIVEVRDTGNGVPVNEMHMLFEPFCKISGSVNSEYPSAGLGLYIAKTFAKSLGGDLTFRNHPEGGAVFRVSLLKSDNGKNFHDYSLGDFVALDSSHA